MASAPEVSQMTLGELATFTAGLNEAIRLQPDAEKVRAGVEESLSGECVQCGIRVSGRDLLRVADGQTDNDSRLERLRDGYCARNGCDSHFYRITRAPHPQIDWPNLLNPAKAIVDSKAEQEKIEVDLARTTKRNRNILRTGAIIGVLVIVFILRQFYMGGSIPFIREPEDFKVDRGVAGDGR